LEALSADGKTIGTTILEWQRVRDTFRIESSALPVDYAHDVVVSDENV
jgi:hypothetical protein